MRCAFHSFRVLFSVLNENVKRENEPKKREEERLRDLEPLMPYVVQAFGFLIHLHFIDSKGENENAIDINLIL